MYNVMADEKWIPLVPRVIYADIIESFADLRAFRRVLYLNFRDVV